MVKKNQVTVKGKDVSAQEYAQVLSEIKKLIRETQMHPIMAESKELLEKLPKNFKSSLPTVEEIEEELEKQKTDDE